MPPRDPTISTEPIQWLDIQDFTPGIHSRVLRSGNTTLSPPAVGAAQPTNTYRCMALPTGGLGPFWTRDYSLTYDTLPDGALTGGREYQVTGFAVGNQPILATSGSRLHELFFGIQWIDGTNRKFSLRRYRSFDVTWDTALATSSTTTLPTTDEYVNNTFVNSRALRSAPTSPGVPTVTTNYYDLGSVKNTYQFPNDATPATTSVFTTFTTRAASMLVAHQGRIIFLERTTYAHGATGSIITNEDLYWTVVNDSDTLSSSIASVFSPENVSGYAAAFPMSANELFAVKRFGGAVTINGDIDDPTVINLPSVPSAYPGLPCASPIGVVYLGSQGGVYAWSGGDSAQPISQQLEDFFWFVNGSKLLEYRHVLAFSGTDHVLLPDCWVYNVHLNSWWRLEDTTLLRQVIWNFQVGLTTLFPVIYGATLSFNATTSTPIIYGWDTGTPASSFSWQSHPLPMSVDRLIEVREVIVEALGAGTVTITFTAKGGATDSQTFTFSSTSLPVKIRRDFRIYGDNILLRIESAHASSGAAPTVTAVRIGYRVGSSVATAG